MKKQATLWIKLKICWYILLNFKEGLLVEGCHYCTGVRIRILNKSEEEHIYNAEYECIKCGATARVKEEWTEGKDRYRNGIMQSRQDDAFNFNKD